MEILWLDDSDVRKVLGMGEVMEAVEAAFHEHGLGNVQMPPKIYLYFPEYAGDLRAMPAYIPSLKAAGVKVVNVHPGNPNKALPTVMAVVILNDPTTGAPIALLNGTYLTDMRTGAAGGIAARYLAREDSVVVGIIGAGRQARTQLMALSEIMGIETVKVSSRTRESCNRFKQDMEKFICGDIVVTSVKDACDSDILVTTTPARGPIVKDEWIEPGTHINAIGADAKGKEELDPQLLKRSKIVVDDIAQAVHSGEVNVPIEKGIISKEDIYCQLGEIIAGLKSGREDDSEITIFDSTGLAIQDIAVAHLAFSKAKFKGLGVKIPFSL
jgi:alanine dehydrogenase